YMSATVKAGRPRLLDARLAPHSRFISSCSSAGVTCATLMRRRESSLMNPLDSCRQSPQPSIARSRPANTGAAPLQGASPWRIPSATDEVPTARVRQVDRYGRHDGSGSGQLNAGWRDAPRARAQEITPPRPLGKSSGEEVSSVPAEHPQNTGVQDD